MKNDLVRPLEVLPGHLSFAMQLSEATINNRVYRGTIPAPDGRLVFNQKAWRLSTIHAWRPDVARVVEQLLAIQPVPKDG